MEGIQYSFEYSANSIMSTIQYDKEATGKSKYSTSILLYRYRCSDVVHALDTKGVKPVNLFGAQRPLAARE